MEENTDLEKVFHSVYWYNMRSCQPTMETLDFWTKGERENSTGWQTSVPVTGKGGSSGHLWNTLLVEEGQVAGSPRRRPGLPQKRSGACSYFKRDEFSTAMKVSLVLRGSLLLWLEKRTGH